MSRPTGDFRLHPPSVYTKFINDYIISRPWCDVRLCGAHLHDVEEDFLPQAVLAFEELVLGVGAGDVSADELLTGGRHL